MSANVKSKERSFNERAEAPIATRYMTRDEIEDFKTVLVQSYPGLTPADITWDFMKIPDGDHDRDDFIMLLYFMNIVKDGERKTRTIYKLKLPLPEAVKEKAQRMREKDAREGTARKRRQRAVFALTDGNTVVAPIELAQPIQSVQAIQSTQPTQPTQTLKVIPRKQPKQAKPPHHVNLH